MIQLLLCIQMVYAVTDSTDCGTKLVSGPEPVPDSQLIASSQYDALHAPNASRLNGTGESWCSASSDSSPYIQVEFNSLIRITAVVTKGASTSPQWVTEYTIQYSYGGNNWAKFLSTNEVEVVFQGNSDEDSTKINNLERAIEMKFLRIYPKTWKSRACLAFDVLGCNIVGYEDCAAFLVTGPEGVSDSKLTASSSKDSYSYPYYARLFSTKHYNWRPKYTSGSYIQVTFNNLKKVIGIVTQGMFKNENWVKTYEVKYSFDNSRWTIIQQNGTTKIFTGNVDRNTPKMHILDHPIEMNYLRIYPKTYHSYPALRFDVLGCDTVKTRSCSSYLVSGSDGIPDDKLSNSSQKNTDYAPSKARLDAKGCWCPLTDSGSYIQAEFERFKQVTGIVTQGGYAISKWVTSYKVRFSDDGTYWARLYKDNSEVTFSGNSNQNTHKTNVLEIPRVTKFVRIYPYNWYGDACLRFDVIGCDVVEYSDCKEYLVSGQKGIPDSMIKDSSASEQSSRYAARLFADMSNWCPSFSSSTTFYIQVQFHDTKDVSGIITQGHSNGYVTKYFVQYSHDGVTWTSLLQSNGNKMLFIGNTDANSLKLNMFEYPLRMNYLRIYPRYWSYRPCMRFDVLGCDVTGMNDCAEHLVSGESGVSDNKITSSSNLNGDTIPIYARLFNSEKEGAWCPSQYQSSYIQVELNSLSNVSGVITQGTENSYKWTTEFLIRYSQNAVHWSTVQKDGKDKIFMGNLDGSVAILNQFDSNIEMKYLRIYPRDWNKAPCLRFEVLGCVSIEMETQRAHGEFVPLKVDSAMTESVIWNNRTSHLDCIERCHRDTNCVSIAFDHSKQQCRAFSAQYYRNDFGEEDDIWNLNTIYYFDRSLVDHYGYTVLKENGLCYKVHATSTTVNRAKAICKTESARMLSIISPEQLKVIKKLKEMKTKLARKYGMAVDGAFQNTTSTWRYFNGKEIPNELWWNEKKNHKLGECVMVTSRGLSAVRCDQKMYFICGL